MKKIRTNNFLASIIIVWIFLVTTARAIRAPNDFSETYWLLDYRFGFIKRGLVGALSSFITGLFNIRMNPTLIIVFSAITFFGMVAALFFLLYRISQQSGFAVSSVALSLVFASSPFVVMNAHLFGYFDALLYLFAITAVIFILRGHPLFSALVSAIAIFSHESYFLIGFPLVCLATFVKIEMGCPRQWGKYIFPLSIPLIAFMTIALLQSLTMDVYLLRQQLAQHLDSFGFVSTRSTGVAQWQTTSFLQFYYEQHRDFWTKLLNRRVLLVVSPSLVFLLVFIYISFKTHVSRLVSFLTLGAIGAPLIMHAVAWDAARISIYPLGSALIATWILAEIKIQPINSHIFLSFAMIVLALNAFGRLPLMDGEIERFSNMARLLMYSPAIAFVVFSEHYHATCSR